jgi:hypothetical protein
MKKLLLLILTFSLVACSGSDDDNNGSNSSSQSNVLSVGGADFNLVDGALEHFGQWGASDAVNIDLNLISFEIGDCISSQDEFSFPEGQDIYFEMWTSQDSYLSSGNYEIVVPNDDDNYSPFDISVADYTLDLNVDENSDGNWIDINSGTVIVERSGNNYTISWDTIDENGNVVAGSYSGTLLYCDYSDEID